MKVIEAINKADALNPNSYSTETKIEWLSNLDTAIFMNIISTHEEAAISEFNGYDTNSNDAELLVPSPYDSIYIYWLQVKIEYWNQEIKKHNNAMVMYNTAYSEFERYYNRTHLPKGQKFKYFG